MERLNPTYQDNWNKGFVEGLVMGYLKSIKVLLDIRFGAEGLTLMPQVRQINDPDLLEQLLNASKSAADLTAFRNLLPPQPQS